MVFYLNHLLHYSFMDSHMWIGQLTLKIESLLDLIVFFMVILLFLGLQTNGTRFLDHLQSQNNEL